MNFSASAILLALISTTIIFCGCSKEEKVETPEPEPVRMVTCDKIQERGGVCYEINQETPFTGLEYALYPDGQKSMETNYKDGKQHGVSTAWHENGQKSIEANHKDGKTHGVTTWWRKNGQKSIENNFKDGRQHGVSTMWH